MEQKFRILIMIICIVFVLYAFVTLQFLLGIVAAVIMIVAILVIPSIERWISRR